MQRNIKSYPTDQLLDQNYIPEFLKENKELAGIIISLSYQIKLSDSLGQSLIGLRLFNLINTDASMRAIMIKIEEEYARQGRFYQAAQEYACQQIVERVCYLIENLKEFANPNYPYERRLKILQDYIPQKYQLILSEAEQREILKFNRETYETIVAAKLVIKEADIENHIYSTMSAKVFAIHGRSLDLCLSGSAKDREFGFGLLYFALEKISWSFCDQL